MNADSDNAARFLSEFQCLTYAVPEYFRFQDNGIRWCHHDIGLGIFHHDFPAGVGDARGCTARYRFRKYLVLRDKWQLCADIGDISGRGDDPDSGRSTKWHETLCRELYECLSEPEHIYELLRLGRGTYGPESAAYASGHYDYVCVH